MQSKMSNPVTLPEGVSWEQVIELLKQENYQQALKKIHPSTFKFALEESNRPKVVNALLKALKKKDTEHATKEYVGKLVDLMQEVGGMVLKPKNKTSLFNKNER